MAGSKTRFGFSGNGEEPPDSGESGAARTVIGHDIHLQNLPPGFVRGSAQASPTPLPPTPMPRTPLPRAPILAPMPEVVTESVAVRRPYRPQKSRLARFLGRWTTGGHFRPRSRGGDSTMLDDEDDLELPRDTTGRNVLLVLVIALFTFLVTFAIVKIRQRYAPPQPTSGAQVLEPRAEPVPLPQVPAPTVVPPAPPATPTVAEKTVLLGTPAPSAAPQPASPPRPRPQKTPSSPAQAATARLTVPASSGSSHPRKRPRVESPAAVPPEHLKGELLPLAR
jgi:hypothetical protein